VKAAVERVYESLVDRDGVLVFGEL